MSVYGIISNEKIAFHSHRRTVGYPNEKQTVARIKVRIQSKSERKEGQDRTMRCEQRPQDAVRSVA